MVIDKQYPTHTDRAKMKEISKREYYNLMGLNVDAYRLETRHWEIYVSKKILYSCVKIWAHIYRMDWHTDVCLRGPAIWIYLTKMTIVLIL